MGKGDEFVRRICRSCKSDEEWLSLEKEVLDFIADPSYPEREKDKLRDVSEMLFMACDGIRFKRENGLNN